MLQLNTRTPQVEGFLQTGVYSLLIARIVDNTILMDSPVKEYVFTPNPTDIDVEFQVPNIIQPDQLGGYYADANEVGVGTIRVRGTTGQYPGKGIVERTVGGTVGRSYGQLSNLLGVWDRNDGYKEFMKLHNFLVDWFRYIRDDPSGYAMLWVNVKDAEVFQVLPMQFMRPRTATRPLQYSYALVLQVLGEHSVAQLRQGGNWLSRMNMIRNRVSRWRQAVNQASIIMSYMVGSTAASVLSITMSPVQDIANIFRNMNNGVQGVSYVANSAVVGSASTVEQLRDATTALYRTVESSLGLGENRDRSGYTSAAMLPRATSEIVPPTRFSVGEVFEGVQTVRDASTHIVNTVWPGGARSGVNPDDPLIDSYGASLDLWINGLLATELAPLPDDSPTSDAYSASSHMHEAARLGAAGYLSGREDELTSAVLSAETYMLDGERHPSYEEGGARSYSLSYIAAMVMGSWARGNDGRISAELDSFRRGFLGARNPATLAPLYRVVQVGSTDTIYTLATKYLGAWTRWYEIVLLNNLTYPYVSTHGGDSVAVPGDSIYIPAPDASVPLELVERLSRLVKVHDRVKLQDAFLGFDIEIGADGDAVFEKTDLAHITGVKAFIQELALILGGSGGPTPTRYPGVGIKVGTKSRGARTLAFWSSLLKSFLASDDRVDEVVSVRVLQNGSVVQYSCDLKFKNYDSSIVVAGEIRPT